MSIASETFIEKNFVVTQNMIRSYAWASGDYNPIHYESQAATKMGLKGPLAHGMFTMGWAQKTLIEFFAREKTEVIFKELDMKFSSIISVGDSVSLYLKSLSENGSALDMLLTVVRGEDLTQVAATLRAKVARV